MQAAMVIPAAVSIAFGILFATVITLFLIPSLYMMQNDGFAWGRRMGDLLLGKPESGVEAS
jgi:hypothetical protein